MPDKPQTIVFVEVASAMGGAEFSTLSLAQQLDRSRWRPVVVCPGEGPLPQACRQAGVEVQLAPRPGLCSTSLQLGPDARRLPNPLAWLWNGAVILAAAQGLVACLADRRPALLVTKGLLAHFYGGLAARRLGTPCLWHVQDFISERFGGLYRAGFGQLSRRLPTHIVVDGRPIARQLPGSVQPQVSVVYNGVDTGQFRPGLAGAAVRQALGLPAEAQVIGHVARITPWKGQHYLLEAFAQLAPDFPEAYLLLVGSPVFDNDHYERRLREQIHAAGLARRVILAGYRTDLPQVLAAMDIFAYPSIEKDTSPLAVLSAMAMGLPIAAFEIEGLREIITPGSEGLLVPARDSAALAQALRLLLTEPELRRQLSLNVRQKALHQFSLERYVAHMEAAFQSAISARYEKSTRLHPTDPLRP
jgi:glycosyltransferase involved in cell wall biosynthesis